MALSTITRHPRLAHQFRLREQASLGRELRRRRRQAGLSQAALGAPLTRAYVSAVEHGRVVPSLPALEHMVARLGIPLSEFFASVEGQAAGGPAPLDGAVSFRHGDTHAFPPPRGSGPP